MARKATTARRQRGFVRRRGNSYEVVVYAGVDPLTGKASYLSKSTRDEREVDKIRTRLLGQVDDRRVAAKKATLGYTLDEWLDVHDAAPNTLASYRRTVDRTIRPALGDVPIAKITARTLEEFYGQLRRCRSRCDGTPDVEHRTTQPHECRTVRHRRRPGRPSASERENHDCATAGCHVIECPTHVCRPMAASTVREIHAIISGALGAAVRWEWIGSNPATLARKPKLPRPDPRPPTPKQAARIVDAAFAQDDSWGLFVWLAMITGARRGELVTLRWHDLDRDTRTLAIRRSYVDGVEKDTKTH
jgi:integrase